MPPSFQTPRHSRNSSLVDSCLTSPQNRRLSKSSVQDGATSFRDLPGQNDTLDISTLSIGGTGVSNGMGNLADELADAFEYEEEEEEEEEEEGNDGVANGGDHGHDLENEIRGLDARQNEMNNRGTDEARGASLPQGVMASGNHRGTDIQIGLLSPHRKGHLRKSSQYDGSEYGSDSDLDTGIPPSLMAKMDAVESLARRGMENYGGPEDDVLKRVISGLRDLGPQLGVENSAQRLVKAHSALTTHLTGQTRQLHNLTFQLLSPLSPPPDPDMVESLVPLLMSLSEEMPRPSTSAYNSLTALHSMTLELIDTLSFLTDTLHMSRQVTVTATRRLKSAKELVADMRREEELREEGEQWLARGNWDERLEKRECAVVCGEVIGGFEDVCNGWRERLLAQAESQA